jgi:hypothetical protein
MISGNGQIGPTVREITPEQIRTLEGVRRIAELKQRDRNALVLYDGESLQLEGPRSGMLWLTDGGYEMLEARYVLVKGARKYPRGYAASRRGRESGDRRARD